MQQEKIFQLSSSIQTHKGLIEQLVLKPPTARSFVQHGAVYRVTKDQTIDINYKALIGFVSDMSGHDTVVLQAIPGVDMNELADTVIGMLIAPPPSG